MLLNLVKNALKFTRKGSIDIKAGYDSESMKLIVYVKDTGAGIAKEDISKLFNRFGKLQRTAKLNKDGIGLGLTIVKQIVEKSGGKVGVKSEGVGHGSLFFFTMNLEMAQADKEMRIESETSITNEADIELMDQTETMSASIASPL